MLKEKRIIITGSSGFIAPHLIRKLSETGCCILGLDKQLPDPEGFYSAALPNTSYQEIDLNDYNTLRSIVTEFQPNTIFHLASRPDAQESHNHAIAVIDDNIKGTVNLLEAFSQCNYSESFVYGDSVKVYGNVNKPYCRLSQTRPNGSYAIGKLAGWHFCELYGNLHRFNSISVRPTLIFGPGQPNNIFHFIITSVLNGNTQITLMGGDQTRSPLYIDDAVNAYITAAIRTQKKNGEIFNIGGSLELSIFDLANMIVRQMDAQVAVLKSSESMRNTEICASNVDLEETFRQFNWKPLVDLPDAVTRTIQYYQKDYQCSEI